MDADELIEEIANEVLKRFDPTFVRIEDRRILVVLHTPDRHVPLALTRLLEDVGPPGDRDLLVTPEVRSYLAGLGINCRDHARDVFGPDAVPGILHRLHEYRMVVVPAVGFHTVRAIAELRDEDPFAQLVLQALLRGLKVVMLTDALVPAQREGASVAPGLRAAAEVNLKKLLAYNIVLVRLDEIGTAVAEKKVPSSKDLITEQDIIDLKNGDVTGLRVPPKTIVTPLARDKAKELGITIIRE